jgi:hypothetical protein
MLNEIQVHWALEVCPSVLGLLAIHEDKEKNIFSTRILGVGYLNERDGKIITAQ